LLHRLYGLPPLREPTRPGQPDHISNAWGPLRGATSVRSKDTPRNGLEPGAVANQPADDGKALAWSLAGPLVEMGDAYYWFYLKHIVMGRAMNLQAMSFIFGAILLAVAILGGGFEIKEIKVSNVTIRVRIISGVVGLIFIGLGFLGSNDVPVFPEPRMSEREHDKDRWGGDYYGFDIKADHIEDCEDTCKNDTKCAAWTYVKPGVKRPQALCFLKNVVPVASDDACCVSGTKIR
jgi:hypothetical protein